MNLVQTDERNLSRDIETGALLSTDIAGFTAYKKRREEMKTVSNLKDEVETLKSEVSDMKSMLSQILEKVSG